jgi:hypothetical protein
MMKTLLMGLFVFSAFQTQAQTQNSHVILRHSSQVLAEETWTAEALLNGVSNSQQPTLGATLFYTISPRNELGTRALTPMNNAAVGTTSLMAVYRHHMSESKTHIFFEGTLGDNAYTYVSKQTTAPSLGTNVGLIHHFSPTISAGGIGGIEWTQTAIGANYASTTPNSVCAYLRVAAFGAVTF